MRWLLTRLLGADDRDAVERDLEELFARRRARDGDRAARRWRVRARAALVIRLSLERLLDPPRPRRLSMSQIWRDAVYAVRAIGRAPIAALTIVLTIGVGLGAATAMARVVQTVLLAPLPYADPDNLHWIYTDNPPFRFRFSVVDYRALEADHPTFSAIAAYQSIAVTVTDGGTAERVTAKSVTGSYFPLLGQSAAIGRLFSPADDATADRVAVLTTAYWRRRFGADPAVVGRMLQIDGVGHLVVGVLQPRVGPLERDVAVFTAARWPAPRRKGPFFTMVIGRLAPGASPAAATQALRATNARLFPIWRSSYQDEKATWGLMDLRERVIGDVTPTVALAAAAVGCVLLIACVNAMHLRLARSIERRREVAIRSALGASRRRLVQQVAVETALLVAAAAAVGGAVAYAALRVIPGYDGAFIPRLDEATWSIGTAGWLAALSLGAALLLFTGALLPTTGQGRGQSQSLRDGDRAATGGPAATRVRRLLVALQFALATPLLVAAALVTLSLDRLASVPVGIDLDRVFTAAVSLTGPRYETEASRAAFWRQAIETLRTLPGVEAAAIADSRPPADAGQSNNFDLEDHPTPAGENQPISTWVGVSPEFFPALNLRLERGRLLDDRSLQEDVVVVDRAWADRFFPGEEVLGRRLKGGGCTTCPWTTVVGVVPTVKWTGLDIPDPGTVYYPFVDLPNAYVIVRSAAAPDAMTAAVRDAMSRLDAGLALSDQATGPTLVADSLATPRSLRLLVSVFAISAVVLAVVGIYGVMACYVEQQTREIGIRLALGANPSRVRRMVVGQGLVLVLSGVTIGLAAALLSTRLLDAVLFGVSATDPLVLGGVAGVLTAAAIVACLMPGRQAARLDPAVILRSQ